MSKFAQSTIKAPSQRFPLTGNSSYRRTLKKRETIEDPNERERILSACHQRCADRTLKVLEKNGGIFIKLGQHLVSTREQYPGPIDFL
jgi:predicted unusual protein kinase regulating ubiquinone biosynthesis (AarF/ABC1/UbiB family)